MKKYSHKKTEVKWQSKWEEKGIYRPDLDKSKNPFYNLMMFPYPSGEGLHVGHAFAFTGADIYGRKKRMEGMDVFQPMGYDSFGIHSENYAIKANEHPASLTAKTTKRYERQLKSLGIGFDWTSKLLTSEPDYYKWTQWIFIKLFKAGLAYKKKASVNWCNKCMTVLADEQVIALKCERCGNEIVKRELDQWFFKITKYSERLLSNLDNINWSEKVKIAQRNWIGSSEGALIDFSVKGSGEIIKVFTTRPDTLFGATYMVLSPEHELIRSDKIEMANKKEIDKYIKSSMGKTKEERISEGGEKTGVAVEGALAVNPVNNEEIPIFVADYVLGDVGTGAIMAVPAHDQRDFEFAKKYSMPLKVVIKSGEMLDETGDLKKAYEGEGMLINSLEFDGMDSCKAKQKIIEKIKGERKTVYRLRDWLISRQRYWGPPIPMIWCDACNKWMPEEEKNLPVLLPDVKNFRPTGTDKSPLANFEEFYKTRCPECGGEARRETDVSDTFLDSAWYYIRYLDTKNNTEIARPERIKKWLPVNMYIGGAEHSVLHLLYVRFLSMAFHDLGEIDFSAKSGGDPITKFRAHGLLIKDGAKMSKSRGNVVNPDQYIKVYGADAFRMYLMFLGPYEEGGDFSDTGIRGMVRFLDKVWKIKDKVTENGENTDNIINKTIKKVSEDIDKLHYNTAISALMICLNELENRKNISSYTFISFIKLLSPFAPHLAEEIYNEMGEKRSIHISPWPAYDENKIREESFNLVIQINGRTTDVISVPVNTNEKEAKDISLNNEKVTTRLSGRTPKKFIYVKGRLINIVI